MSFEGNELLLATLMELVVRWRHVLQQNYQKVLQSYKPFRYVLPFIIIYSDYFNFK